MVAPPKIPGQEFHRRTTIRTIRAPSAVKLFGRPITVISSTDGQHTGSVRILVTQPRRDGRLGGLVLAKQGYETTTACSELCFLRFRTNWRVVLYSRLLAPYYGLVRASRPKLRLDRRFYLLFRDHGHNELASVTHIEAA
jgi:hypothetical protein